MYTIFRFLAGERSVSFSELKTIATLFGKDRGFRQCGQGDHSTLRWQDDWQKIPEFCVDVESGNRFLIREGDSILFLMTFTKNSQHVLTLKKDSPDTWIFEDVRVDTLLNKHFLVTMAPKSFSQSI